MGDQEFKQLGAISILIVAQSFNIFSLKKKTKKIFFADLLFFRGFSKFKKSKMLETIFCMSELSIHKPILGSCEVLDKIWARSVEPFGRLLDTNGQTNKQTSQVQGSHNIIYR